MRELLFRCWDGNKMWTVENWDELQSKEFNVMQYTGLKDKNGVLIYEGDIVKSDRYKNSLSEIVWSIYVWAFRTKTKKGIRDYEFCVGSLGQDEWDKPYKLNYYEIIGNVYENPEFLETTKYIDPNSPYGDDEANR